MEGYRFVLRQLNLPLEGKPGSRQAYCPSSPAYREAAAKLVEQLATRYAGHPALVMWHVNNEYGCHVSRCWCDRSAAAFRDSFASRLARAAAAGYASALGGPANAEQASTSKRNGRLDAPSRLGVQVD